MADPIREMRGAEHMVLRLLIGSLWEEVLLSKPDPVAALDEISNRMLGEIDKLAEQSGSSDIFNHAAIHEMETLWAGVRRSVEKIVEIRNQG